MPAERRAEYLADMTEHVDHLARLVGDLSEVYRMDEPHYVIERQRTDLVPLLQHVVASVERAAGSGHRLRVDAPREVLGEWDAGRLEQVFINLLNNAVKFSPQGSEVLLRVTTTGREALVSVSDEGVGLEADELPRLFQPFSRVGVPEETEGSGLGLYIARTIVEAHGGKIWAESAGRGTGTTVSVAIPYGSSQS